MRRLIPLLIPVTALAQNAPAREISPYAGLMTWFPFLLLIGIFWLFMRRITGKGSNAYSTYIRELPQRMERVENHLADIAASLRKIAESERQR